MWLRFQCHQHWHRVDFGHPKFLIPDWWFILFFFFLLLKKTPFVVTLWQWHCEWHCDTVTRIVTCHTYIYPWRHTWWMDYCLRIVIITHTCHHYKNVIRYQLPRYWHALCADSLTHPQEWHWINESQLLKLSWTPLTDFSLGQSHIDASIQSAAAGMRA